MTRKNKTIGVLSSFDLKRTKYKIIYFIMFITLCICAAVTLIPSIWILLNGFKSVNEMYAVPATFFPSKISFARIMEAWRELKIGYNILATIVLGIGEIVSMVTVCGLGGYVLSRLKPKGSGLVFAIVVWTMMMPRTMRTVPLFMEFISFPVLKVNMLNTYWPLFLMAASNSFNVMLFKNFFDSISLSLIEAAKIDGCNDINIFTKIMLPLSVPVLSYTCINQFNVVWGEFFYPLLILTDERMQPVPTVIYRLKTSPTIKINTYMMALTIACIPPILTFIFLQKKIIGGINVGGVKG